MHILRLTKPDGRTLLLYARTPLPSSLDAPSPNATPLAPNSHLRWHPLRGEWVAYASHRQNRTFLPPPSTTRWRRRRIRGNPTEVPARAVGRRGLREPVPHADAARARSAACDRADTAWLRGAAKSWCSRRTRQRRSGRCRCRTSSCCWTSGPIATTELGARDDVQYVYPFENRGVEVGVTLHHPHGQIYAYPVRPADRGSRAPVAARSLRSVRARPARRSFEAELADGPPALPLHRHTRARAGAGVRAISLRSLDRATPSGAIARRSDARTSGQTSLER